MSHKTQRHIFFYLIIFVHFHICPGEQANTVEQAPTLHESSRDLGKAFIVFFNALGREITEQAQELGTRISNYVESIQSQNNTLFSIEQQTAENRVVITIKGFEHIDASACCDAHVSYNYQNVADKVTITVGPDAKVIISAFESPLVNNIVTVAVEALVEKIEEVKQDDTISTKTFQSTAQKTVSFTVEQPVNLDAISIEFDAQNKTLQLSMPFVEAQTKSVRVRVR